MQHPNTKPAKSSESKILAEGIKPKEVAESKTFSDYAPSCISSSISTAVPESLSTLATAETLESGMLGSKPMKRVTIKNS
jgi:hypothetical protein